MSTAEQPPYPTLVWDWAADCSRLDLWSWGGKGLVSKTAARPTDNECSSVDRTQLSDTGVGDELTIVGQVTQGDCSFQFFFLCVTRYS